MPHIEPGLRVYAEYLSEITPVDYELDSIEDGWRLADVDLDSRATSVVRITPAVLARAQERLDLLPLDAVEALVEDGDDDMLVELALRSYAGCTLPQDTEAATRLLEHINIDLTSESFQPELDVHLGAERLRARIAFSEYLSNTNVFALQDAAARADIAAAACRGEGDCPAQLRIANALEKHWQEGVFDVLGWTRPDENYDALWVAWGEYRAARRRRLSLGSLAMECAAQGCEARAGWGRALGRCGGRCSLEAKPAYCSKECQRADWKALHKRECTESGRPLEVPSRIGVSRSQSHTPLLSS
ncbi:hypothetical protein PENSPDRAFT_694270 [Peniophora sp. CONT]|nr:hypothetical protein PENSPDRAFT_694270 [Peniophora sp. CONT]